MCIFCFLYEFPLMYLLLDIQLVDDPIFIPIEQLEQDKNGEPAEFSNVVKDMKAGKTGYRKIHKARKGKGKVLVLG